MRWFALALTILMAGSALAEPDVALREGGGKRWLKGNTHTHSLWSDGDAAPEKIAAWYKDHEYHFLVFSEHNQIAVGDRWIPVREDFKVNNERIAELQEDFGADWVELKVEDDGRVRMRLKNLEDLKNYFDEPGEFLLIPGEELTSAVVHMNGINLQGAIRAARAQIPVEDQLRRNLEAIAEHSAECDVPMLAHLNHPNFATGVTAEEMIAVGDLEFFEVYNGHNSVRNWGRASEYKQPTDKLWDIILAERVSSGVGKMLYGVGSDDSHEYFELRVGNSNSGRGWVMVLTDSLDAEAIVRAMHDGDFYASSGVTLSSIEADGEAMRVAIDAEDGVSYTTKFIGTRVGYDASSEPARDAEGNEVERKTRIYSDEIGEVLFETDANPAVYEYDGDELYVRAKVVSSKLQDNPFAEGDFETAWTQPVQLKIVEPAPAPTAD